MSRDEETTADSGLETLGARLRRVRLERGLSQRQVATAVGIRQSTYSGLERDENTGKSLEQLAGIARHLDVRTDYLLGIEDANRRQTTLAGLTPLEAELVRRAQTMRPDRQRTLLRVARDLSEEDAHERRYRELVAEIQKIDTAGLLERSQERLYVLAAELGSMRAAVSALMQEITAEVKAEKSRSETAQEVEQPFQEG